MNRSMLPDWPMIIAAVIGPTPWIVVSDVADAAIALLGSVEKLVDDA